MFSFLNITTFAATRASFPKFFSSRYTPNITTHEVWRKCLQLLLRLTLAHLHSLATLTILPQSQLINIFHIFTLIFLCFALVFILCYTCLPICLFIYPSTHLSFLQLLLILTINFRSLTLSNLLGYMRPTGFRALL